MAGLIPLAQPVLGISAKVLLHGVLLDLNAGYPRSRYSQPRCSVRLSLLPIRWALDIQFRETILKQSSVVGRPRDFGCLRYQFKQRLSKTLHREMSADILGPRCSHPGAQLLGFF